MKPEQIVIVIPAYNPGEKMLSLLENIYKAGFQEVIIINDGSASTCAYVFEKAKWAYNDRKPVVLQHAVNMGKGRALKTAFNYILNEYPKEYGVITVDADGQHEIEDIIKISECIAEKGNSIIMGCRCFGKEAEVKIPLRSKFGNVFTRMVLRYLCNINISDTQTGLRGIPASLLPDMLRVSGEKYEYEMNMLLNAVESNVKLEEVPIQTIYDNNNETSHFNPLKDSLRIYMTILKYSLASIVSVVLDNTFFIIGGAYTNNIWGLTFGGRIVSAIFNFTINRNVVFKKTGKWFPEAMKYLSLLMISGTLSATAVQAIGLIIGGNVIVIKLFVETILFFLNFYVQKNIVFGGK